VRAVVQVSERDAHARAVQPRRILERGTELVEGAGQVHQRIEHHRHFRLRKQPCHLPRLRAAHDDRACAVALRERQHLPDVAGAIDPKAMRPPFK